jgi:hypothetical protein
MQSFKDAALYELLPRRSPVIESPELERLPSIRPLDSPTSSCPPQSAASSLAPWDYYRLTRMSLPTSLPSPLDEEAEEAIQDAKNDPHAIALPASPPYSHEDLVDEFVPPTKCEDDEDLSLLNEPPPRDYPATDVESSTVISFQQDPSGRSLPLGNARTRSIHCLRR